MNQQVPQEHAEFVANTQAKIKGHIKISPAFPKIDETGAFKVAYKVAGPHGSDWAFVEFPGTIQ